MKERGNILSTFNRILLVAGILIGFYAMTMNYSTNVFQNQQTEESSEDIPAAGLVIKAFDAITYSTQINFNHHSILIEELPDLEVKEKIVLEEKHVVSNCSKALKILFRSIISPNAP